MASAFTRTEEGRAFIERIAQALVECCGKESEEAETLIRAFWADLRFLEDDSLLYTETPYYYAMCIAHHPKLGDNQPEWYLSPEYFPPPAKWRS
jgi:hypothetical protein